MPDRYAIREEHPGVWTVYDVFTGQPAIVHERTLAGMDIQEADEMSELLNLQDRKRRTLWDKTDGRS
jgi:hypothetical protein